MDVKPLVGLAGVVVAVSFSELNDQVVSAALPDIAGGLGIGRDASSWLRTLYLVGLIFGAVTGPSLAAAVSQRKFLLGAVGFTLVATLLFPLSNDVALLYLSRGLQGIGEGFIIANLIAVALKVLPPAIRLYGLCFYGLTATCIPSLATSLAALWVDGVHDWRFVFLQSAPLAALAALLIWWGLPSEPPQPERWPDWDWPGALLVVIGFGAWTVLLEEGEQFDWFNSPVMSILALVGVVGVPLFVLRELVAKSPLIGFHLLKRRNLAYPSIALVVFLVISTAVAQAPITFLQAAQGYRPLQSQTVTLETALSQLVLLPATAWLLDFEWVDARVVSAIGLLCILASCGNGVLISSVWNREQFIPLAALQAVGLPLVIMPLLMMATNALKPEEGPLGSSLVNSTRGLAEAMAAGLLALIGRWGGAQARFRILDTLGANRIALAQAGSIPAAALRANPSGRGPTATALSSFEGALAPQVATIVAIETYVAAGAIAVLMMLLLATIPERTAPPRIALAKGG